MGEDVVPRETHRAPTTAATTAGGSHLAPTVAVTTPSDSLAQSVAEKLDALPEVKRRPSSASAAVVHRRSSSLGAMPRRARPVSASAVVSERPYSSALRRSSETPPR